MNIKEEKMDMVDKIIEYESGQMSEEDQIEKFEGRDALVDDCTTTK